MCVEKGPDCLYAVSFLGRARSAANIDPCLEALLSRPQSRVRWPRQNVERHRHLACRRDQSEPRCHTLNPTIRIGRAVSGHKLIHGLPNRAHGAVEVTR